MIAELVQETVILQSSGDSNIKNQMWRSSSNTAPQVEVYVIVNLVLRAENMEFGKALVKIFAIWSVEEMCCAKVVCECMAFLIK